MTRGTYQAFQYPGNRAHRGGELASSCRRYVPRTPSCCLERNAYDAQQEVKFSTAGVVGYLVQWLAWSVTGTMVDSRVGVRMRGIQRSLSISPIFCSFSARTLYSVFSATHIHELLGVRKYCPSTWGLLWAAFLWDAKLFEQ